MRVLDLFSGIGGFSLGLERAGMQTVAFCEVDKDARKVLRKHWPGVPIYEDVKTLKGSDVGTVELICGGFPCQDISFAGKGAGLEGERSGLWFEFHRLIQEIRPRWVVAENVSALRSRGLDTVLRSLAEIGYDAEWHCIPACAVGAPHRRDRIWLVAYPSGYGCATSALSGCNGEGDDSTQTRAQETRGAERSGDMGENIRGGKAQVVADTESQRWPIYDRSEQQELCPPPRPLILRRDIDGLSPTPWDSGEPSVGRVVDGVSAGMGGSIRKRLKQLGNAVVPQIPELIGRAIMEASVGGKR